MAFVDNNTIPEIVGVTTLPVQATFYLSNGTFLRIRPDAGC